ncbi:Hypothetical predicted protein [Pelobates cultripes]|uniref:Ciliary microtubule inner protein 2B n=1 Tax=Pelobates cultripes TaxID=61616 RepID=A0AAD1S697_PELCU|nr:Hypothetical predicted protein [Pelobates cultripes]
MPAILPQLPESMFTTYDPKYTPGYTSYVPKLRSDIGKIYGNATLRYLDYEPGLKKGHRLSFTTWDDRHSSLSAQSKRREFGDLQKKPFQRYVENVNRKNGFLHDFTQMKHTYDGNPRMSSAIHTVEETKHELNKPLQWTQSDTNRYGSERHGLEQWDPRSNGICEQRASSSCPLPYEDIKMRTCLEKKVKEKEPSLNASKTSVYLQKRLGKIIYRADSGLLPNYSGYTPGQMFAIGNTWGRSTMNAVGKIHVQPFLFTSLI